MSARAPARVRRGYVDAAGGQVHLRRAGEGSPILLLHQMPASSSMWEPLVPRLAACGHAAIALDLPGCGLSDPPPEPLSLEGYAEAVLAATDALGLERFDLVGHHTGISVGLAMAVLRPDRVRRLVGYGIPLLDPAWAKRLANETAPEYERSGAAVVDLWTELWDWSGSIAGEVVPRTVADMLLAGPWLPWIHHAVGRADHTALLRSLRTPLLALAGTREGLREQTESAAALTPWARFVELGDVGGFVADEAPEAFADVVAAFLALPDRDVVAAAAEAR